MFVVSRPGDEIALVVRRARAAAAAGRLDAHVPAARDGYSKEMDLNSASPDQAWPLPFRTHDALSVRRAGALSR